MGFKVKNPFIFSILATVLLGACGGGGVGVPTPEQSQVTFSPTPPKPTVTPDLTALSACKALPGNWEFQDIAKGEHVTPPTITESRFSKKFVKSWGGTTTAYAVWNVEAGDEPVWNEGRTVHFGSGGSFTTHGMIHSIHLSGTPSNMTALIGTSDGLVIADVVRDGTWKLKSQKTVDVMGPVRSVAMVPLILEKDGPYVPMVFMVAGDSVTIAKLADLRANAGCITVAYQAKDHPVDPKDSTNKRVFRPIKIVAGHSHAAFLTATRLPEEFSNAVQFKTALQNEWTSFQSTAYLIDVARETPVEPIITTMGDYDRFFASDIGMVETVVYLFGNRYKSSKPAPTESGIAVYKELIGTPVVGSWAMVPADLAGDFRMGRFDTRFASAYVRGLDRAARVENFLSPPTQQKWSGWKEALPFDYVRGVSYRLSPEPSPKDPKVTELDDVSVETPQFVPNGPRSRNWTQLFTSNVVYTPITTIVNATTTDVDYLDVKNRIVHQHMQDEGKAVFPLSTKPDDPDAKVPSDIPTNPFTPRLFHTANLIFFVRHSNAGPYVYVYKDTINGIVNITDTQENSALIGFWVNDAGSNTMGSPFSVKAVAGFEDVSNAYQTGMGGNPSNYRIDDIRELSNPLIPQYQHLAMLVHSWNGLANIYRIIILQMDLKPAVADDRAIEIQGCSDFAVPGNNYSGDVSYGNPDDQPRFMGPFQAVSSGPDAINYVGYFQHHSLSYNVWRASMIVTSKLAIDPAIKSNCSNAGELTPITDPVAAESVAATLNGNAIVGLHSNGLVRWKVDAKTTQYIDIGNVFLGGPVTVQKGKIVPAGTQFLTQMDTSDGLHPSVLLGLDSSGESCPSCQFTDLSTAGDGTATTHPERGIELYNFSGN